MTGLNLKVHFNFGKNSNRVKIKMFSKTYKLSLVMKYVGIVILLNFLLKKLFVSFQ